MTEYSRVLLVGGPADGEWRDVDVDSPYIELLTSEVVPVVGFTVAGANVMLSRIQYRRTAWQTEEGSRLRFLYVGPGLSASDVWDRLVQFYGKPLK